jgi:hypothetical protein
VSPSVVAAVLTVSFLTPSATAAVTETTPDTVRLLEASEPGVLVPADGRLNDYELTGRVLGVATGTSDTEGEAARGQRLWVFGLDWTTDPAGRGRTVGIIATVNAGTTQVALPLPARADPPGGGPSGAMWFRASLPAAPTTTVTVTAGGYPQTFALTTMTRQAPTPVALYRTATSWETTQSVDVTDQIPTPAPVSTTPPTWPPPPPPCPSTSTPSPCPGSPPTPRPTSPPTPTRRGSP